MSLYSSYSPAGAQFDRAAPWEPDYVEQSIHEIDSKRDEPMMQHPSFPVMPDTQAARAWKERLMRTIK